MHLETIIKFRDEELRKNFEIQQHLFAHTAVISIYLEKYINKSYSVKIK